jgi:DNA mismatch endonuclease (patch repair protein)
MPRSRSKSKKCGLFSVGMREHNNGMDTLSPADRSLRMSLVRSADTKPEMIVRRIVHALGYRFRLHVRGLPGSPDLVFPRHRAAIFVHGCFWHRHSCAMGNRMPKSRVKFWRAKLDGNRRRDRRSISELRHTGWRVLVIWECQTRSQETLRKRLSRFLST